MPFTLSSAAVVAPRQVLLTFNSTVQTAGAAGIAAYDIDSYTLSNNASVTAVLQVSAATVLVYTTELQGSANYTISVVGALTNTVPEALTVRSAAFTAPASTTPFVVANLRAASGPRGRCVDLQWSNPAGTDAVRIIRTLRSWPYDFTENTPGSVTVFESYSTIESFTDLGLGMVAFLTANAAAGVSTVSVGSFTFVPGDTVRLVRATGEYAEETKVVLSIGLGTLTFTTPLANSFSIGDHVGTPAPLNEQTYYYYTVLVSSAGPLPLAQYDLSDASRAYALSVGVFNSKDDFLWPNTPAVYREMDALSVAEGGGGGALDQLYEVMGGWLNVMRGNANAIALRNDPDMSPLDALVAANASLGFTGEGLSYDYDALRRTFSSITSVYKKRGTCPGVQQLAQLLVRWATVCVEFGQGGCIGLTNAKVWDGVSELDFGADSVTNTITQVVTDAQGAALFTDPSKGTFTGPVPWDVTDRWADGKVRSSLGDVLCVQASAATAGVSGTLTIREPYAYVLLTAPVLVGATSIVVDDIRGFQPGQRLQLIDALPYAPNAHYSEIVDIAPAGINIATNTITLRMPTQNAYNNGSRVTLQTTIARAEFVGEGTAVGASTLTDTNAFWVENQWVGYKLLYQDGVVRNIVSNTGNVLTVTGAAMTASGTNDYRIAADFSAGTFSTATAYLEYRVGNGVHTSIFEPTWSPYLVAEPNDPRNRLWQGPGSTLLGAWGPTDVGIYVTDTVNGGGPGVVASGKQGTVGVQTSRLVLDPIGYRNAGYPSLVGYYLNPNQNQTTFFEILIDNGTSLVVAGDISSFVVSGQPYYVLSKRDMNRFLALQKRVFYEFTDTDVRPRLLMV